MVSTEAAFLGQMNTAMKVYAARHNGQPVTNWEQLREVFDVDYANKHLRGRPSHPLEDHYEFVPPGVSVEGFQGSEVILIRTVPLQEAPNRPNWRYLIVRTKGGGMSVTRRSEDEVQAMFQKAGVSLPLPKPGLPPFEMENLPDAPIVPANERPDREANARSGTPDPPAQPPAPKGPTPQAVPSGSPILRTEGERRAWPWAVLVVGLGGAAILAWKRRK